VRLGRVEQDGVVPRRGALQLRHGPAPGQKLFRPAGSHKAQTEWQQSGKVTGLDRQRTPAIQELAGKLLELRHAGKGNPSIVGKDSGITGRGAFTGLLAVEQSHPATRTLQPQRSGQAHDACADDAYMQGVGHAYAPAPEAGPRICAGAARHAVTCISTLSVGLARAAWTQARAGGLARSTQASQILFMRWKSWISASQIVTASSCDLLLCTCANRDSICARICRVCPSISWAGSCATWPAR